MLVITVFDPEECMADDEFYTRSSNCWNMEYPPKPSAPVGILSGM